MKKLKTLSEKTLVVSILLTVILSIFFIHNNYKTASLISDFYTGIIGQTVDSLIYLTEIPESDFAKNNNSFTLNQFNATARNMQNMQKFKFFSFTSTKSLQYVYPYDDFKHMIGTSGIFKAEESRLSQIAASSNTTVTYIYQDPYSNEDWLLVKNPIITTNETNNEEFYGFITVGYLVDEIAPKMKLDTLERLGYNYELGVFENDGLSVIKKSKISGNIFSIDKVIELQGSTLEFRIFIPFFTLIDPALIILTFLSLRFVYYAYIQFKHKKEALHKQHEYDLYIDSLTGAYSRNKLENLLEEKTHATLLYIALKGHDTFVSKHSSQKGDELLVAFSKRLQYNVKDGYVVRLVGDEFIVFLEGEIAEQALKSVKKRVKDLASQPFSVSGLIANISANVGHSTMPKDGTNFTSLLNVAMEKKGK